MLPIFCVCFVTVVCLAGDYQRYALMVVETEPMHMSISQVHLVALGAVLLAGYAMLRRTTRVRVRREENRLLNDAWIINTDEYKRFHQALGRTDK